MSESGGNSTKKQYRPSSSKARSRPTTAEYDRALQEDIMEEGNADNNPRIGPQGPSTQVKCAIGGGVVLFVIVFTAVLIGQVSH